MLHVYRESKNIVNFHRCRYINSLPQNYIAFLTLFHMNETAINIVSE